LILERTLRIPRELYEFLKREHTLLIKGEPGTGKTVLSLELLRIFSKENTGVYFSSRVPRDVLYEQYPWLEESLKNGRVIVPGGLKIEDLTLETVESFIERLIETLKETSNPFVVIDSWDALVKGLNPSERIIEEKNILSVIYSIKGRVIFVMEAPETTSLDYLVDGIVTLRDVDVYSGGEYEAGGRRRTGVKSLREMELNKLRGILRLQKKYIFTLQDGRFRSIQPFGGFLPSILLKPKPIIDPDEKRVSSGIEDFDAVLNGGLERGSFNLIEQGFGVGMRITHSILIPMIVNNVNLGRGVVIIPSEGFSIDKERKILEAFTDEKAVEKQIVCFSRSSIEKKAGRPILKEDPKAALEELLSVIDDLKRKLNGPMLLLIGIDTLEHIFEFEALNNFMGELVSRCSEGEDVILAYGSENLNSIRSVGNMTTTHWKLNFIHKTLLISGIIPQTGLYAMVPDLSKGFVKIDFIPIV